MTVCFLGYRLKVREVIVCFLYCDTLHLNQPGGATNGCKGDYVGNVWESGFEHVVNDLIVGSVSQVDYNLHHVAIGHAAFLKEFFYVFPHAFSLTLDVAYIEYLAMVVD